MAETWDESLTWGKYHLSITKRLIENYYNYEEKRFLIGIINELALTASHTINAFLLYSNQTQNTKISTKADERIKTFKTKITPKLITKKNSNKLIEMLNIKKAQKASPIQYQKKENILLLIKGEYKTISINTLKELSNSTEEIIKKFPKF